MQVAIKRGGTPTQELGEVAGNDSSFSLAVEIVQADQAIRVPVWDAG